MDSSSNINQTVPSIAWNPSNPSMLFIPSRNQGTLRMDFLRADRDPSCNAHELAALLKILDKHQIHYQQETRKSPFEVAMDFSQECRAAVQVCFLGWRDDDKETRNTSGKTGLLLLESTSMIMHLLEIFVPLFQNNLFQDPFLKPGLATADMVRFLRYHFVSDPDKLFPNSKEMLESTHPEQFHDGTLYWNYLRFLVKSGCLLEAWEALSRHSRFVRSLPPYSDGTTTFDSTDNDMMRHIQEGFLIIKELLLRAPIPAGRTDKYDDAIGFADEMEDTTLSSEYILLSSEYILDGLDVSADDYKFWEREWTGMGEVPILFNSEAAVRKHRTWSNYVKEIRNARMRVMRYVPELDSILQILSGDLTEVDFESWAEKLCAELLYRRPDLWPRDLHTRARRLMEEDGELESDKRLESLLNIMMGQVSKGIEMMYMLGGASGAALPATLMALYYNMLVEANAIPREAGSRRAEFLCEAASAIVASLTDESRVDVGARLATQLLVPHICPGCDPTITASLVSILDHYSPRSDSAARSVLELCRAIVEKKSMQLLDGCSSIILQRFQHYMRIGRPGGAMHWVMEGIDMESLVYESPEIGPCYRKMSVECHRITSSLLRSLLQGEEGGATSLEAANEVLAALKIEESNQTMAYIPAQLLFHVTKLVQNLLGENPRLSEAASHIVSCLQERKDNKSGHLFTLAQFAMVWPLLCASKVIFAIEEESGSPQKTFDKKGICVLMEHLEKIIAMGSTVASDAAVLDMRRALANALSRSFVVENAQIAKPKILEWDASNVKLIRSVDLHKYKPGMQEKIVQHMLDF